MQVASASVSHTSTGPTRAARSSSSCWRRAITSKSVSVQTYGSPRASLTARPTSGTQAVPSRSARARARVVVPVDSAPVITTRRHR